MKIHLRNRSLEEKTVLFLAKFQIISLKRLRFILVLKLLTRMILLICFQCDTMCPPAFIPRARSKLPEACGLSIELIPRVQLQLEAHYLLQATSNQTHKYLNHLFLSQIYQFSTFLLPAWLTKRKFFCKSKLNFPWSLFVNS